MKVETSFS